MSARPNSQRDEVHEFMERVKTVQRHTVTHTFFERTCKRFAENRLQGLYKGQCNSCRLTR